MTGQGQESHRAGLRPREVWLYNDHGLSPVCHWHSCDLCPVKSHHVRKASPHPDNICLPPIFCFSGCAKDVSWAGRKGKEAAKIQRCKFTRKTSEGYSPGGFCPWPPREEGYPAPPKYKGVPSLCVTSSCKAKHWGSLKHQSFSKYSIKWCIWAINTVQALCKRVHFCHHFIPFIQHYLLWPFRANCLRNRSTAHS